jgi:uncharacterized glyoxalase superfamily protein PhnB
MAQNIYPALRYTDARAAIEFLKRVAGFEELAVMENEDGTIAHAELVYEGGVIMLGTKREEEDPGRSAGRSVIGRAPDHAFPTGPITIYVAHDDVDAHHEHAVAAGADVVMELTDQDYGSREYAIRDPDGNVWTFGTYRPEVGG